MNCLTAIQIESAVAGDLCPPSVASHLEACVACRAELAAAREREGLLGELRQFRAPALLQGMDVTPEGTSATLTGATLTMAPDTEAPPTVPLPAFPGYQVLERLKSGGQGALYRALQERTKRSAAIKVLLTGTFASTIERRRFEREIELVAQLRHPHIVTVFEAGQTADGLLFLAMDFVDGQPLDQYVQRQPMGLREALALLAQVCDAVEFAHQRGIMHRDLKPGNILVDTLGQPRLLDFGLARPVAASDSDLTEWGQVVGTLPYMSPEQVAGDAAQINTLTDVYALGVILYRVLTGTYPYPVKGPWREVQTHILETPPTPLERAWSPDTGLPLARGRRTARPFDRDLTTIVLQGLAKDPQDRYQSAGALAADLRRYLAGEPILARRDSPLYVLSKIAWRYRLATAALVSVFVITGSLGSVSFWFYREARNELAARRGSETKLRGEYDDFAARFAEVQQTQRRMALGWFLLEWRAGRAVRCREIAAGFPEGSPEALAASFLLEANGDPEALRAALRKADRALAEFVLGEAALQRGDPQTARACLTAVLDADPRGWWAEAALARLDELDRVRPTSRPAGSEGAHGQP